MKLKKIASLMLAGVMAVSMLAGCSGNGSNNNNNSTEDPITPTVSSASSTVYEALNADTRLSVTSAVTNSTMDQALEDTLETYWASDHFGYWYNGNNGTVQPFTGTVIENNVAYALKAKTVFANSFVDTKGDVTVVKVYAVGDGLSEKGALTAVAAQLDNDLAGKMPANGVKDGVKYEYDYNIAASVASEDTTWLGDTYTLRIVAVDVTQTATEV